VSDADLRESICEIGRRLYGRCFVAANDGNISVRLGDEVMCTPSMVSKGFLRPADLCVVDLDGRQLSGPRKRTSEILLHLAVYRTRPDVTAVVHAHPPHAVAFAATGEPVPGRVLPEVELFLGDVPTVPYETPGTAKFAASVIPYLTGTNTLLLANHGTVCFDADLELAWFHTETIDAYCRILLLARQLGPVRQFSAEQAAELHRARSVFDRKNIATNG
jgi:L-fuculose-phosphate aldolase